VGSELEAVYAVSRDNVRAVHIKPELIGIASDYDRKGSHPHSCWYKYEDQCIRTRRETIANLAPQKDKALTSAEAKHLKAVKLANLEEMIPSHRLLILKAKAGSSAMAIITMDQSLIVQPLAPSSNQGYIGNLIKDIPPVMAYA
jgi:hypothetical protein